LDTCEAADVSMQQPQAERDGDVRAHMAVRRASLNGEGFPEPG